MSIQIRNEQRAAKALSIPSCVGPSEVWGHGLGDDICLVRDAKSTIKRKGLWQHPAGWLAREVHQPAMASTAAGPSAAGLALGLALRVLDNCRRSVERGERLPGQSNWPLVLVVSP
jgi:hypothetical protein